MTQDEILKFATDHPQACDSLIDGLKWTLKIHARYRMARGEYVLKRVPQPPVLKLVKR